MTDEPVMCVVEIPTGSANKYELDPALGAITLDRLVSAAAEIAEIAEAQERFREQAR